MNAEDYQNIEAPENRSEHDYGINTSMEICELEIKQEPFEEEIIDNVCSVEVEPPLEHVSKLAPVVFTTTQSDLSYLPSARPSVKKSIVWNFFQIEADKKTVVCNICHKRLKFCGNTTNFKEHLKRLHPQLFAEGEQHIQQHEDTSDSKAIVYTSNLTNGLPAVDSQQSIASSIHQSPGPSTLQLFVCNNKTKQVTSIQSTETVQEKIQETVGASSSLRNSLNHNIKTRSLNLKTKSKLRIVPRSVCKKSIVWKYFKTLPSKKFVRCIMCKKHFKSFRDTSNLKEHLKQVHSNYSITRFQQNDERSQSPAENHIHLKNKLDEALVRMIVTDFQPLFMTENYGFKRFVTTLNPTYNLPPERVLADELIPKYFNEIHSELVEELKNAKYISLTAHLWQSKDKKKFVSINAHYVKNYERCSKNLATRNITQQDTKEIFNTIGEVLEEYQIYDKSIVIVLSTRNSFKDFLKCELKTRYLQCVGCKLGAIVNDSYNECTNIKNIIKMYQIHLGDLKQNIKFCNKLREKQHEMGLPDLKLKHLTQYKWHLIYIMLERFLAVRQPLIAALNDLSLLSICGELVQPDSVAIIEDLVSVFKPMFQLTQELSVEKYVTVSNIIPLFKCLDYSIRNLKVYTDVGNNFKESLLSNVIFSLNSFELNKLMAKATFLDPRFKRAGFSTEFTASTAERWVVEEVRTLITKQKPELDLTLMVSNNDNNEMQCTPMNSRLSDDLWAHFDNKVAQQILSFNQSTSWASLTVRKYAEMALLPRKEKPLKYWDVHSTLFPELVKLAEKYLSIPATSTPAEMLFSKHGGILRDQRSMVDPDIINEIVFLNANM